MDRTPDRRKFWMRITIVERRQVPYAYPSGQVTPERVRREQPDDLPTRDPGLVHPRRRVWQPPLGPRVR